VPRLCGFYPDICPTTQEKARKKLSHGQRDTRGKKDYLEVLDVDGIILKGILEKLYEGA